MTSSLEIKLQDSLLPMISILADSPDRANNFVNVLLDVGSQTSFMKESVAVKLGLKTYQSDIAVTLKGFTGEQKHVTRTVLFSFRVNSKNYEIICLCIPEITVRFSTPHLKKLVELVQENGQELAYKPFYSSNLDSIENIECIIGSRDWDIVFDLPRKLFGDNSGKQSACYYSDNKVIPIGSVELFINNFKYEMEQSVTSLISSLNVVSVKSEQENLQMISSTEKLEDLDDILDIATYTELNEQCNRVLNVDQSFFVDEQVISESEVTQFVLDNSTVDESNRHELAIPWISRFKDSLGTNERLAHQVLKSVLKKYANNHDILERTDEVFRKQMDDGIVELISDLNEFKTLNKKYSFIAHFPLIKDERKTTKIRVIYMANLAEKKPDGSAGISLNQTVHQGFCKNSKISTAFSYTRFDKYMLCFDIKAAFHQILVSEANSAKFLFLWFKNVRKKDFTPVVYRFKRLPFGLSCSPFLLSVALHKFLIEDQESNNLSMIENDKLRELKKLIYNGAYVDNLFCGANDLPSLEYIHDKSVKLFDKNRFPLQQFCTNHMPFQTKLDFMHNEQTDIEIKILGMTWNRETDEISAPTYRMDEKASTKRQVLRELNRNYDLLGTKIPLLNRSKLFLRKLQMKSELGWDTFMGANNVQEWRNIVKQYNTYNTVAIPRCMGKLTDEYELCILVDASKSFIGMVSYLKICNTRKVSFLEAHNKLLDRILRAKTMPVLEFSAIVYGVKKGLNIYQEFQKAVVPVKINSIRLFSDNTIALSWLSNSENLKDKAQKRSTFINNRINEVVDLCRDIHPIHFVHIGTDLNSADFVTRNFSPKRLLTTNFLTGPDTLKHNFTEIDWIVVPNPNAENDLDIPRFSINNSVIEHNTVSLSELIQFSKFSSLRKAIRTLKYVQRFRNKLKKRLYQKDPLRYLHFKVSESDLKLEHYSECERALLLTDQKKEFPELFEFFQTKMKLRCKIPSLISQMNLVLDPEDGLIKVKSKMGRLFSSKISKFPVLLSKSSKFMKILVSDLHKKFNHSGIYYILNQLRRRFFVLKAFSSIKNVVINCVHCRRFNARPTKLNSSEYKSFMVNPRHRMFATVFLDYAGPFYTRMGENKQKTYIVLFKDWWSRAIHIEVTDSADTAGFLLAFQNFIYEYGLPEIVHSDAGSNLSAGFSWLKDALNTVEIKDYFNELKIKTPSFSQFPRGSLNRGIPSFIESGIKMVKRLIQGAIRNNILSFIQFCSLIKQCVCLANKRPLNGFSSLRDQNVDHSYRILTPEVLKFGYETCVLEVNVPENDADNWTPEQLDNSKIAFQNIEQIIKIKGKIRDFYHDEFLYSLMDDATRHKGKYLPVKHQHIKPNDIVIIRDPYVKPSSQPMGLVLKTTKNALNEVTQAVVLKANKAIVTRDSSDLTLLLRGKDSEMDHDNSNAIADYCTDLTDHNLHKDLISSVDFSSATKQRAAAKKCNEALKNYYR